MVCPRCGSDQPAAAECRSCGIVISKWQARAARPAAAAPAPAPAPVVAPVPTRAAVEAGSASAAAVRDACTGLARLVLSGIPLVDSLRSLAPSARGGLAAALSGMAARIEAGDTLADAMARWPGVFRAGDVAAVRAAERVGDVPQALEAIADRLDAAIAVRRQLLRGAAYPLFVLATSILLAPITTIVQGGGSAYARAVAWPLIGLAVAVGLVVLGLPRLWRSPAGPAIRRLAWSLPWPATLYTTHVRALFCKGLSRNLAAGLALPEALRVSGDATADPVAASRVAGVMDAVRGGRGLAESLAHAQLAREGDLVLLAAGERSGTLDVALVTVGDRHADRLARGLRTLTSVTNVLLTLGVFAYAAAGLFKSYQGIAGSADDLMKGLEKEIPMLQMP